MAAKGREVFALGSVVVLLPWSVMALLPSLGGVVAWLAPEAVGTAGRRVPVEDEVFPASTVTCPCVSGLEVNSAVCISTVLTDGFMLSELGAGLDVMVSDVTVLAMPGAKEAVEEATAVDVWVVASQLASVMTLVLPCCKL